MEFSKDQWAELAAHAREKNLIFISTPFSVKAIEILKDIGMPAWKISSGEVKSDEMLEAMTINRSPMLLSTGMSDFSEIEMTVSRINEKKIPYAIFQCTTKYPCALEDVGLNVIHDLREKFRCPTGLSDHSGTVFPGIAAIAQGADLLEVHVIFDRKMFGPDVISSITIEELKFMVEARNAFFKMFTNPVDKNIMAEELTGVKSLFSKSIASRMFLPKGTILKESMLTLKKPGTGIPGHEINNIKGRRLKKDVSPERLLKWDDLEKCNE
jgi:N,N'-diacetyllegionaminate synthase